MNHQGLTICGVAIALTLALPGLAGAATITVTGTDDGISDNGVCSLREAVIAADTDSASQSCPAGSGADTIVLPAGRYGLFIAGAEDNGSTFGNLPAVNDLDVSGGALTIQGAGTDSTVIDANGLDRALDAYDPLTVADLSIVNGHPQDSGAYIYNSGSGGAIRASAPLTVVRCFFGNDRAAAGLAGESVTGNTGDLFTVAESGRDGGDGGAIYAESTLTVTGSRFEGNAAGDGGRGGDGTGGAGPGPVLGSTGRGGAGFGGGGGDGGSGGAIWVQGESTITGSTFDDNGAGTGGTGGTGAGGKAGIYQDEKGNFQGGTAGGGQGGPGGAGGSGGAVFIRADVANVATSYFAANEAGGGGAGGSGIGGPAGTNQTGGNGIGGAGATGGAGGAIASADGAGLLTLANSTLDGDLAGTGGFGGAATGDKAPGGTAGQSTAGNGGDGGAGGGGALSSDARLVNLTVHANRSGRGGNGGVATFIQSSLPAQGGNGGRGGAGGGVANVFAGNQTELRSSTLTDNGVGSGGAAGAGRNSGAAGAAGSYATLAVLAGGISLGSSIVEGQLGVQDCSGGIEDQDGNLNRDALGDDASCPGEPGNAGLGPLTDNGGPVPTQRPDRLGPAVDRAPAAGCPETDARLVDRPSGAGCDIGAYEVSPPYGTTTDAQNVNASGGTLEAIVNPQAAGGVVHFEYGTSASYGSSTPNQVLQPAAADLAVGAPVTGYPLGTVVHYRVLIATPDGSAVGADRTFTTAVSASELAARLAAERTPPSLTGVGISAKRFAVSGKPTAISGRVLLAKKKTKTKRGTTFRLTVSKPATVSFAFARRTVVRRHGKKKVRYRSAGTFSRALAAGPHTVPFSGRIGRKALKQGAYRAQLTAVDAAGNRSSTATLKFTIVRK